MLKIRIYCLAAFAVMASSPLYAYTTVADYPFAPAAGETGTTAIHKDDTSITGWATGYQNYQPGSNVDALWQTPTKGLGPAAGGVYDIVCLGRGGQITLSFDPPIRNGTGYDFAVFENSFSDTFLELAWVEVSSDGIHFVRFHNYSATAEPVGAFGNVEPRSLFGYAGKYRQSYGTPFDLTELKQAYDSCRNNTDNFPPQFRSQLLTNFPYLDLNNIQYVRLVDIVGDGTAKSAILDPSSNEGYAIYDPFPTVGSAGFDLDAVAAIHQQTVSGTPQSIAFPSVGHQRFAEGSISLYATSDSGLPVSFTILSGPATIEGQTLLFTGKGTVVVEASQPGNSEYAPASPIIHSFVIAEELQYIYVPPPYNRLHSSNGGHLTAIASSGLPVSIEIVEGPASVTVGNAPDFQLNIGNTTGLVRIRAYQEGNSTYAPAPEIYREFYIVSAGDPRAPETYEAYAERTLLSEEPLADDDYDGASNFLEYASGTDAQRTEESPSIRIYQEGNLWLLEMSLSQRTTASPELLYSPDLVGWSQIVPLIHSIQTDRNTPDSPQILIFELPNSDQGAQFWQIQFQTQ